MAVYNVLSEGDKGVFGLFISSWQTQGLQGNTMRDLFPSSSTYSISRSQSTYFNAGGYHLLDYSSTYG